MNKRLDCLAMGEANVDLLIGASVSLEAGKEKLAHDIRLVLGGSSSITAFNLAALGTKVGFIGVIGRDVFGDFIEQRLASAGVDLEGLRRDKTTRTGITVWFDNKGSRSGITYLGTIPLLRVRDISTPQLKRARHLHVGHYFLLTRLHPDAPDLFERVKRMGLTTSLDCNYDPSEKWNSRIKQVLRHTDIFFPNGQEAMLLTGCRSVEAAARELGKLARIVAVKLGAEGVLMFHDGESFRVPARKVRVVDTTGAGDSFNAGFLSQFLRGASLRLSAKAGVTAAARCVGKVGGTAAFEHKP
jgi:sugar/nucleoside kinase (ribokinase family)